MACYDKAVLQQVRKLFRMELRETGLSAQKNKHNLLHTFLILANDFHQKTYSYHSYTKEGRGNYRLQYPF